MVISVGFAYAYALCLCRCVMYCEGELTGHNVDLPSSEVCLTILYPSERVFDNFVFGLAWAG